MHLFALRLNLFLFSLCFLLFEAYTQPDTPGSMFCFNA